MHTPATSPPPRRRVWPWIVTPFAFLFLLLLCGIALRVYQAQKQAAIVREIVRNGGWVEYFDGSQVSGGHDGRSIEVDIRHNPHIIPLELRKAMGVDFFSTVRHVDGSIFNERTLLVEPMSEMETGRFCAAAAKLPRLTSFFLASKSLPPGALGGLSRDIEELILDCHNLSEEELVPLKQMSKLRRLQLTSQELTDRELQSLPPLPNLIELYITSPKVTDDGICSLQLSPHVEVIELHGRKIGDKALFHFKSCANLRVLSLRETGITDAGLASLANHTTLVRLNLADTGITGAGLKHLKRAKSISTLILDNTTTSDEHLSALLELPRLEQLSLRNTPVGDEGCAVLAAIPISDGQFEGTKIGERGCLVLANSATLCRLGMARTPITDMGVAELAKIPYLLRLDLEGTQITDAGLKRVASTKTLEELSVTSTHITASGIRAFEESVFARDSHVKVIHDFTFNELYPETPSKDIDPSGP